MSNKLLLLCLAAVSLVAQPKFEIYGRVLEAGTNHPIEGARVIVVNQQELTSASNPVILRTDAQGDYRYVPTTPSFYSVQVTKAKYANGVPSNPAILLSKLDEKNPSRQLNFTMAPLTELTGRLVNTDTNQPIVGLTVRTLQPHWVNGELDARSPNQGRSNEEGRVTLTVAPGSYAVLVPRPLPVDRLQKNFTEEEAAATDLGYGYQVFSGGPYLDTALTLSISLGGSSDFGTLRLMGRPLYRVRVSVGGCAPGETVYLRDDFEVGPLHDLANLGEVPCGREFLLKNMQPGKYAIHASTLRPFGDPDLTADPGVRTAIVVFDVGESNRNLSLTLGRGITIEGRVVVAQGSAPITMARISVQSQGITLGDFAPLRGLDNEGRFRWENLSPGRRGVSLVMPNDFYIKEVRVRGIPIRGRVFDMLESGEIELEIDSNPASVGGSVLNGDKPVPNASVAVVPWPLIEGGELSSDTSMVRRLTTDAEGRFQAVGFAPGEYRIFAVANEDVERSQSPAVWPRMVSGGEKLILTRGATSTVALKLTDPSR